LAVKHPLITQVARTGCSLLYPGDLDEVGSPWICPVLKKEICSAAIVPLQLDSRPVGVIWVGRYNAIPFKPTDVMGLERLADDAVIAIEHATMGSRLQSLAVTEERGRIAREMHDGLAQILGYLSVQMQTLESLAQQGKTEAMSRELRQARERIRVAQSDVRENILSLRTTLGGQAPLIPSLREYVEEFEIQTGIHAELHSAVEDAPPLSPIAEAQLARIVQEALTNTRKHSNANRVEVQVDCAGNELRVLICDDGIGMNLGSTKYHFGLQTMRERAASVGGRATIDSTVGKGTQVQVWIPLLSR
jgi:signal transduction histidine kinase